MTTRSVGVIVPSYGTLAEIVPLLTSLIGPNVPAEDRPDRVVVVDDAFPGPIDESVLPDGAELIRREHNGGFGAAVNTGLAEIRDLDLALVLNSDLTLPERFLSTMLEHAEPWLPAVIGCRSEDESGRSGYAARIFPTESQQIIEWLHPLAGLRHLRPLHRAVGHDMAAEESTGMVPVDWVSGAVMLLPIQEVLAVGGLDEDFFMYTEEVDLQRRLAERGIPAVFDADLTVKHVGGGSSGSEERRRGWLTNARDLYARKHLNPTVLRSGLYAASAINLIWGSARKLAGRPVNPWRTFRFETGLLQRARRFHAEPPGADHPRTDHPS